MLAYLAFVVEFNYLKNRKETPCVNNGAQDQNLRVTEWNLYVWKKSYSVLQCRKLEAQEMLTCQVACWVHSSSVFGCAVFQRTCLSASAKEQCVKGLRIWKAELKLHCVSAVLKNCVMCLGKLVSWPREKSRSRRYLSKNVLSNLCTPWVCLCFQEESGTTEDGAQERFIGPLPREGSIGCTHDYVSQSYSYSSVLSKSETGTLFSLVKAMLVCNYFSTFSNSSTSRFIFSLINCNLF